MDYYKIIEEFDEFYKNYRELVDNIKNAETFDELSNYERQTVQANRAMSMNCGRVAAALNYIISNRRNELRNAPIATKKTTSVEKSKKTKKAKK